MTTKKIQKIFVGLAVIGIAVLPLLTFAGTCGMGDDCQYCLTQETCEAKLNCVWHTDHCDFGGVIPFTTGNLASIMARVPELFGDFTLLIIVAMGLPLAFWVIRKAISLVRAR